MSKQRQAKKGLLLAFGEVFLKSGGVQKILKRRLINNLSFFLKKEGIDFRAFSLRERIFLTQNTSEVKPVDTSEAERKVSDRTVSVLKNIFGLAWWAEAYFLKEGTLKSLEGFVEENYRDWIGKKQNFALRVKGGRAIRISREEIIDKIARKINRKVDLGHPDKEVFIEGRKDGWFVYFKKQKGAGGLPAGSQGRVLSLISGGIDSPAAAWLMAKRGAESVWLHFHSFPLVSRVSIDKTKELARLFIDYQPKLKAYFIPFSKIQTKIKVSVEPKYRVLLYRRLMFAIAEKLAEKESCRALVTGESLGQVSSQTLTNLAITQDKVGIPILRPLIGLDKQEIINLAKKIGTYEISIRPQEDCCTLFVPKHQTAAGKLKMIEELERSLVPDKLIEEALGEAEIENLTTD